MSFINPLDLFGISPQDPAPDSTTLRKARRAKLLEFDLADEGLIDYEGVPITRADFLRACEEIEEPGKLAVYRGLQRLPALQQFLLHGSLAFFDEAPPRWAYHPQFLEVIGPHYADRFASALAEAVREGDRGTTRRLTSRPPVAPERLYPRLYGDAERVVTDQARRLEDLRSRIEQDQAPDASPARAASGIVDVRLLEELPPYFEGARSKVGQAARLLAVTAFNDLDDVDAAAAILRSISDLSVNAITADRIRQDLEQIESIRERRQLSERHAPTLETAAAALVRLRTLTETAEAGPFDTNDLVGEVEGLVDVDALNKLPEELSELRDHCALSLRALALACWNKHYEADLAVALTKIAIRLRTSNEVSERLWDDVETLQEMGSKASAKAAEEGQLLLNLLRKVDSDTNAGFFGPSVNWVAVERFLDDLFDEGGIRLLRALKDEALKTRIRSTLYSILNRLGRHRASGASRIRARVQPALATPTPVRSAPAPPKNTRPPATPKGRPASSTSGRGSSVPSSSAAPAATISPNKSNDEGSMVPIVVGLCLFFGFILLVVAANNGGSSQPPPPRPTPPPVTLGPSMEVTVVAANGKLSPVRVKVDDDARRPYWVELGDEVTFTVTDSAFVEQELEDLAIRVNGKAYPTDYRDNRGRIVITRESATASLNGRPPPRSDVHRPQRHRRNSLHGRHLL